jgi:serine/threonine-protein kinase
MGDVWKAWDSELARWVALKFLRGADDQETARFRREAQLAGRLSHPNITAVYEVLDVDGRPCIAMQYVEGRTLRKFPADDLPLVARLVRDAALAVQYAHEREVLHRDLKPENLMVVQRAPTPGGKRAAEHHVFVMDFGLARPTRGGGDLSQPGVVIGTPAYMSPEQARGERTDERSDVYSLGATLYALVCGRPPFDAADVATILDRVQEEEPVPMRRFNPKTPADLETIVMRCLEKHPLRRYASAGAMAEDLTRWLRGEPILAGPPSALFRVRRAASRHRVLIVSALAFLAVAAAVTWRVTSDHAARREAEARALRLREESGRAEARDEAYRLLERARATRGRAAGSRELLEQARADCVAALRRCPDLTEAERMRDAIERELRE